MSETCKRCAQVELVAEELQFALSTAVVVMENMFFDLSFALPGATKDDYRMIIRRLQVAYKDADRGLEIANGGTGA